MQSLIGSCDIVLGKFNRKANTWTVNRRVLKKEFKRLKTVWRHKSHDAGTYGTVLLNSILGSERIFSFPKSVYAVRDCLAPIARDRKDARLFEHLDKIVPFMGAGLPIQFGYPVSPPRYWTSLERRDADCGWSGGRSECCHLRQPDPAFS